MELHFAEHGFPVPQTHLLPGPYWPACTHPRSGLRRVGHSNLNETSKSRFSPSQEAQSQCRSHPYILIGPYTKSLSGSSSLWRHHQCGPFLFKMTLFLITHRKFFIYLLYLEIFGQPPCQDIVDGANSQFYSLATYARPTQRKEIIWL